MVLSFNTKDLCQEIKRLSTKIRRLKQQEAIAVRHGNIPLAAKLRYGEVIRLHDDLKLAKAKLSILNRQLSAAKEKRSRDKETLHEAELKEKRRNQKEQKFFNELFEDRDVLFQLIEREKSAISPVSDSRSRKSEVIKQIHKDIADLQSATIQHQIKIGINPEIYIRLQNSSLNHGFNAREIFHIALKQLFRKFDCLSMRM
jgi:hypothetical protein